MDVSVHIYYNNRARGSENFSRLQKSDITEYDMVCECSLTHIEREELILPIFI